MSMWTQVLDRLIYKWTQHKIVLYYNKITYNIISFDCKGNADANENSENIEPDFVAPPELEVPPEMKTVNK